MGVQDFDVVVTVLIVQVVSVNLISANDAVLVVNVL